MLPSVHIQYCIDGNCDKCSDILNYECKSYTVIDLLS